jgi:hypothetical protein
MTRFATIPETEARRRHRREDEALLLAFLWSGDDLAYFTRSGSRVPQRDVRKAVDAVVATVRTEVAALGRQVASGEIAVAEWQDSTARLLKTLHVAVGAAGAGGFRNMSPGDTAEVEQTLRFNFERLEGFAQDVSRRFTTLRSEQIVSETGEVQPVLRIVPMTESRIVQRSEMYAAAGSAGYENVRRSNAFEVGYKFERNVLHPADHCELCVEQESRGWVGIGELVPIGQRDCLTHCQCSMAFARELPE